MWNLTLNKVVAIIGMVSLSTGVGLRYDLAEGLFWGGIILSFLSILWAMREMNL